VGRVLSDEGSMGFVRCVSSSRVSDLPERTALKRNLDDFNTFGRMVGGDWGANSAKS